MNIAARGTERDMAVVMSSPSLLMETLNTISNSNTTMYLKLFSGLNEHKKPLGQAAAGGIVDAAKRRN
jgi:hypothetical protein